MNKKKTQNCVLDACLSAKASEARNPFLLQVATKWQTAEPEFPHEEAKDYVKDPQKAKKNQSVDR